MFDMAASRYKGGGGFNEEGSEGAQRGGGVTEGEVAGEKHCGDERESEGKRQGKERGEEGGGGKGTGGVWGRDWGNVAGRWV